MSGLYNMLFGENPFEKHFLFTLLGKTPGDFGRYRDVYVTDEHIVVHTRCGGGNRVCYEDVFAEMEDHPLFAYDEDDDFSEDIFVALTIAATTTSVNNNVLISDIDITIATKVTRSLTQKGEQKMLLKRIFCSPFWVRLLVTLVAIVMSMSLMSTLLFTLVVVAAIVSATKMSSLKWRIIPCLHTMRTMISTAPTLISTSVTLKGTKKF